MKKIPVMLVAGVMVFMLSSCGQAKNSGEVQTDTINNIPQNNKEVDETDLDGKEYTAYDVLDSLIGEYSYTSDDRTGKLIIQKTSDGYDIFDYESEFSYRFLANSSNIENIENNKIYIKYPEQVLSNDIVDFSYYILEYDMDGIDVYYGETTFEEAQLLYRAMKQNDKDAERGGNEDSVNTADERFMESETTVTENYNQDKDIELYVDVLRNYISAGKTDFTVSFIDLDDDSIREMVVFFGEAQADGGYLFTIKNEEAIQVLPESGDCFGQYGGFTYKEKENAFVAENESVTEAQISNQIFYYTMENGNAVCKDVTQSITQFDSNESKFYVNDTEVESERFNSIAEKYGLLEMSTVSYSDGVRVMNEQMDVVYNAYNN